MKDKYSVIGVEGGFQRVISEGMTFEEAMKIAGEAKKYFDSVSISLDHNMRNPSQNILVFSDCEMMLVEVKKLINDRPDDIDEQLVFLGNFLTGDDGFVAFMEYLIELRDIGRDLVLVRGQNEHNLLEAMHETHNYVGEEKRRLALISGIEKQLGYPVTELKKRNPVYYELLSKTYTYFEDDRNIFVAGGLDLSGPWRESQPKDLYITSNRFLSQRNKTGKTIIFGDRDVNELNQTRFRKPWIDEENGKVGINGDVRNYGRLIAVAILDGERHYIGIRHRKTRKKTYAYDVFALK